MKIAVCDDILSHRNAIVPHIEAFFKKKLIPLELKEYSCGEEILQGAEKFDIVFLDIELGDAEKEKSQLRYHCRYFLYGLS